MDAATNPKPLAAAAPGPRVLISSGEASGDAYGAVLVREMRALNSSIDFSASGGARMQAELGNLVADSRDWGAVSISQSLKVVPRVAIAYWKLVAELQRGKPGLFVPIDFGFMNVRLMRQAKKRGWKILTFVPPGSWRRDRQGKQVAELSDAISTPFSWSAELLERAGAKSVHWFGHPIKQILREQLAASPEERLDQVALLPGSRKHEIALNLPILAKVIASDQKAEFGLAPHLNPDEFLAKWKNITGRTDKATAGQTAQVLRRSRAAVVCSGTATLEAAFCRTPMTVIYGASKTMLFEAKLVGFKRPEFIALPNILLQRKVVPEFIVVGNAEGTPEGVRDSLAQVMASPEQQLADFEELDAVLGPDDSITQTARLALELLP